MTARRTAAELRALAALLDNTRACVGLAHLVEVALSHEFAMRFAGACQEAADALDPLEEEEEEDRRWRDGLKTYSPGSVTGPRRGST